MAGTMVAFLKRGTFLSRYGDNAQINRVPQSRDRDSEWESLYA